MSDSSPSMLVVPHSGLASAVLAVMQDVPFVLKTRPPDGGGISYSYASESDVVASIRAAMIRHGLVLLPTGTTLLSGTEYKSANGKTMFRTLIERRWKLIHVQTGQEQEVSAVGDGTDLADKGSYKAMTGALKYVLRQSFLVETGDDPDKVPSEALQRMREIKRDASFDKAEAALFEAGTRSSLLKYRDAYLRKGYTEEQTVHLEGIFWARFPLAAGEDMPPNVIQAPALKAYKRRTPGEIEAAKAEIEKQKQGQL